MGHLAVRPLAREDDCRSIQLEGGDDPCGLKGGHKVTARGSEKREVRVDLLVRNFAEKL